MTSYFPKEESIFPPFLYVFTFVEAKFPYEIDILVSNSWHITYSFPLYWSWILPTPLPGDQIWTRGHYRKYRRGNIYSFFFIFLFFLLLGRECCICRTFLWWLHINEVLWEMLKNLFTYLNEYYFQAENHIRLWFGSHLVWLQRGVHSTFAGLQVFNTVLNSQVTRPIGMILNYSLILYVTWHHFVQIKQWTYW